MLTKKFVKIKKKNITFSLHVRTSDYKIIMFAGEKNLSVFFPFTSREIYTGYYLELFFFNKNASICFEL